MLWFRLGIFILALLMLILALFFLIFFMDFRQAAKAGSEKWKFLPKVELHCHLEDTIRLSTLEQEFAARQIPIPNNQTAAGYFQMSKPCKNLEEYLEFLARSEGILNDRRTVSRISAEVVVDKANEGVKLLEFRYSVPSEPGGLSMLEYHNAVKDGVARGTQDVKENGKEIHVGLIFCAIGGQDSKTVTQAADFDFVGFDIAGGDTMTLSDYREDLDRLNQSGVKITLHAGEEYSPQSHQNLRDAVEKLHALRIGHGIQALEQESLRKLILETKTHLEICPVSEYFTGSVKNLDKHPVYKLKESGLDASFSTDNPTPLGTDLNDVYEILHTHFGFHTEDFYKYNRDGLRASFMPQAVKDEVYTKYFAEGKEKTSVRQTSGN